MDKEVIEKATPEQFYENTFGRLYILSLNETGGVDCNMYCSIKDVEQKDQTITDLEAKLAESEAKVASREDEIKFKEADINQLKWILDGKKKDIAQLKQQLAEKDQAIEGLQEINKSLGQTCNNDAKEIDRLRGQLAEKDELLRQKIGNMKSTDFIRMFVENGFMVRAKEIDNQTAIDELEKLLEKTQTLDVMVQSGHYINQKKVNVVFKDTIDQQIKSLKGEK